MKKRENYKNIIKNKIKKKYQIGLQNKENKTEKK